MTKTSYNFLHQDNDSDPIILYKKTCSKSKLFFRYTYIFLEKDPLIRSFLHNIFYKFHNQT